MCHALSLATAHGVYLLLFRLVSALQSFPKPCDLTLRFGQLVPEIFELIAVMLQFPLQEGHLFLESTGGFMIVRSGGQHSS